MKNEDIAVVQGISVRRVQQIYVVYRKAGGVPVLLERLLMNKNMEHNS